MHQMTSRLSQHFLTCGVSYLTQNVPCRIQPTTSLLYVTDIERIVIYLPKFFSINTHTFLIYCYYSPTNSTAIVLEHLRFTAGARQILVYDYNQGGRGGARKRRWKIFGPSDHHRLALQRCLLQFWPELCCYAWRGNCCLPALQVPRAMFAASVSPLDCALSPWAASWRW